MSIFNRENSFSENVKVIGDLWNLTSPQTCLNLHWTCLFMMVTKYFLPLAICDFFSWNDDIPLIHWMGFMNCVRCYGSKTFKIPAQILELIVCLGEWLFKRGDVYNRSLWILLFRIHNKITQVEISKASSIASAEHDGWQLAYRKSQAILIQGWSRQIPAQIDSSDPEQ